jgi:hypothetical protein
MGNVEDAARPGVQCFHPESVRSRATHRTAPRGDKRQSAGYHTGRTQGSDKRFIQIVGCSGLTFSVVNCFVMTPHDVPRATPRVMCTRIRSARVPVAVSSRSSRLTSAQPLRRRRGWRMRDRWPTCSFGHMVAAVPFGSRQSLGLRQDNDTGVPVRSCGRPRIGTKSRAGPNKSCLLIVPGVQTGQNVDWPAMSVMDRKVLFFPIVNATTSGGFVQMR